MDASQIVSQADAIEILQKSLASMEGTGLAETLNEDYDFIQTLLTGLQGTGDEAITATEALERLEARGIDLNGTIATFDGLNEKVSAFNTQVTKLAQKGRTEFNDITQSVGQLSTEISGLASKGEKGGILVLSLIHISEPTRPY